MNSKAEALQLWVQQQHPELAEASVQLISGDASFRRYFRALCKGHSYIAVNSPPDKENNPQFIAIQQLLSRYEIAVPQIIASDLTQGFILQQDLGDTLLLDQLTTNNVDRYYKEAMQLLLKMQQIPASALQKLPPYDSDLLMREMMLFKDWLLGTHLKLNLNHQETIDLIEVFQVLMKNALEQPQAFVHRDYHSRNLMVSDNNQLVTIDFQDAVLGPVTYDLASLLKDCYTSWPLHDTKYRVHWYFNQLQKQAQCSNNELDYNFDQFWHWFELMGVQRHLKAAGIFCRLNYRDHKPGYLADIPRTLSYVLDSCSRYQELEPLAHILEHKVLPRLLKR